jgi:hypothetical protein
LRTTSSEEQIKEVTHHLLTVNEEIKRYYSIKISGNNIDSFVIDEWMVLSKKVNENNPIKTSTAFIGFLILGLNNQFQSR